MNDGANAKSLSMLACGCLLLPMVSCFLVLSPVLVLLFAVSGTPIHGRASAMPISVPVTPGLSQSPTPGVGQTSGSVAAAATSDTLPPSADPANGKVLFNTFQPAAGIACATCHRADSELRLVGPGLLNVGIRAQRRVSGLSAVAYLRQSIVQPSAYV